MMPEEIKHFELLQNIITRMNTNSFQIKGISIAVVTALLAVYARTLNYWMIPIGYPTIVIFWIVDSFYLQHERKFRGLYNNLVKKSDPKIDPFEMNISRYRNGDYSLISSMFLSINSFIYILLITFFTVLGTIIN